ncbi:VanZ like family protein [Aeromicrobium choanae]|uniref:VanZ like family protein n=1 Tax=Aeromicrobium choanae TaxID=1736691 RepID=A0A1T4Z177_9ACTN|nr:VanZ like family protein [Aeromicrobium choanae]
MPPDEIPTLPVLVPATIAAIAASLGWLHRRDRLTGLRAAVGVVGCVYGAAVLAHVLLPFPVATGEPRPWRVLVHLTPFVDVVDDPAGMLLNILLFVPLGMLLPFVTRVRTVRRAAVVGLLVSLAIEAVQLAGVLVVGTGRIADVDDLVGNTLGTAIGWTACVVLMQVPMLARLVARASWAEDGIASGPPRCRSRHGRLGWRYTTGERHAEGAESAEQPQTLEPAPVSTGEGSQL